MRTKTLTRGGACLKGKGERAGFPKDLLKVSCGGFLGTSYPPSSRSLGRGLGGRTLFLAFKDLFNMTPMTLPAFSLLLPYSIPGHVPSL